MTSPEGVDVSSNNPHPIDWHAVKASGKSFAFVKATEGTGYLNPFAAEDIAGARAAGLHVGVYHFLHPDAPIPAQMTFFGAHLYGCKLVVIDSEMTTVPWPQVTIATHDALNLAKRLHGVSDVMLYSNLNFLDNMPASPFGYPIWLAEYGPVQSRSCQFWQFTQTGTVTGIGGSVDVSRFNGTPAQLVAIFGGAPKPAPSPIASGDIVTLHRVVVHIASNGQGDTATDIPAGRVASVTATFGLGPNPAGAAGFIDVAGKAMITCKGWAPGISVIVVVAEMA